MKFITVSQEFFDLHKEDAEILHKGGKRPHVLVVRLLYKGKNRNFAVPLRSNISPGSPKWQYFPLPLRNTTKPHHRHGLHYIKMFPILKRHQRMFWVGENPSYVLYQSIIDKNERRIIQECQEYLDRYSAGEKPPFSVDIDAALERNERSCRARFEQEGVV